MENRNIKKVVIGGIIITWMLTMLIFLGCQGIKEGEFNDKNMENMLIKEEFEKYYQEWLEYRKKPEVFFSSNLDIHINCEAYNKIIGLGKSALPYIIEKLKEGDFLLNKAISEITGIKVTKIIPKDQPFPLSEQEVSELWLRWWEENKEEYIQ